MPESLKGQEFIRKYIFWTITIILVLVSIWIIKPFITAIISAFVLAFLIKPLNNLIEKKTNKTMAALISILIIVIILIIPIVFIIGSTISQADTLTNTSIQGITDKINLDQKSIDNIKESVLSSLISILKKTLLSIPALLISIVIMLLGTFFILKNWQDIAKNLKEYLPFRDKERISNEIARLTHQIVYGYLLIALLEFIVALTGFYFAGVGAFLILPLLIAILAFIPGLGPVVIWAPTAIYYFITGDAWTAIGVLVTGLIISFVIETLLLAKIVGRKSEVNPLVFLIGILGGVPIFGIFGFIIGPLILVYTLKLLKEGMA